VSSSRGLQSSCNPGASACADLEWKLTYVGSAEAETFDQILDEIEVGPIKAGKFRFVLEVRGGLIFLSALGPKLGCEEGE
jgi:ASF1 like histone chaperone